MHDLLLEAKLARHRKGFLHITRIGKDLLEHPGSLWLVLARHLLMAAEPDDLLGLEWVSVLNALNVAAHTGVTDKELCMRLLGSERKDYRLMPAVYVHILRPLCWLGLLQEGRHNQSERFFTKTALWHSTLTFEEANLPTVTRH